MNNKWILTDDCSSQFVRPLDSEGLMFECIEMRDESNEESPDSFAICNGVISLDTYEEDDFEKAMEFFGYDEKPAPSILAEMLFEMQSTNSLTVLGRGTEKFCEREILMYVQETEKKNTTQGFKRIPAFIDGVFYAYITRRELTTLRTESYKNASIKQKQQQADHMLYCHYDYDSNLNGGDIKTAWFYSGHAMSEAEFDRVASLKDAYIGAIHKL